MSLSTIARAAVDPQFIDRVRAAAHQALMDDPAKANTTLGKALNSPSNPGFTNPVASLMWPVATDNDAAYAYAVDLGKGAPGYDKDIITDQQILDSVNANWPMDAPPDVPAPLNLEQPAPEPGTQQGTPENMPEHVADA